MFEEFKKFIMRGNVVDMATGVIIGAAFGKIVSSFTADILIKLVYLPHLCRLLPFCEVHAVPLKELVKFFRRQWQFQRQ